VRLTNQGPESATLVWGLYEPPDEGKRTAARVVPKADGSVKLRLDMAELVPAGSPESAGRQAASPPPCCFAVEPRETIIPPGKEAKFSVTFMPPTTGGTSSCRLVAHLSHPRAVQKAKGDIHGGEMTSEHPAIHLQLHADSITPQLIFSEREKLKFKVSPIWPKDSPCYTRELVLRNGQPNTLRFALAVPAPFVLQRIDTSCTQDTRIKEVGMRPTVSESSFVELHPRDTLRATISYVPQKKRRARRESADADGAASETDNQSEHDDEASVAGSQTSGVTAATGMASERTSVAAQNAPLEASHAALKSRSEINAEMAITFDNGTVQTFPLKAVSSKPYVELSRTDLERDNFNGVVDFGIHHVACPQSVELQVANPSEADAYWSLKHLPAAKNVPAGMTARRAAELAVGFIDNPDVFVFSARQGAIGPKRGMIPSLHPLTVRFVAPVPGRYRSAFIFKVKAGMAVKLELAGESTLEEEYYDVEPNERHLSLMLPGVLS